MQVISRQQSKFTQSAMPLLKKLFWVYFFLLIFEGALRKWIFPQYSAPLLLIRDPIAVLIILEAYRENRWPEKWSMVLGILSAALIGLCVLQIVFLDNEWYAAIYGLRSYLLPFLVAFIMGDNLDEEDLHRFGQWTLWLLLPLTALEIAQYLSPPTSILNKGAYAGSSQIIYVVGHARASATFSFVSGPAHYGPMAAAFVVYGLISGTVAKKWLLWAAASALVLSVPVVGSRGLFYQYCAVIGCAAISSIFGSSRFARTFKIVVPFVMMSFLISLLPFFSQASASFKDRFQGANAIEGGTARRAIQSRTVTPFMQQIMETDYSSHPIGVGMGRGAAAITRLMNGNVEFTAGEGELGRAMAEMGPFPGVCFMLFRYILAVMLALRAFAKMKKQPLALLLLTLTVTTLVFSVFEQPTEQGFAVVGLAFILAALNHGQLSVSMTSSYPQGNRAK